MEAKVSSAVNVRRERHLRTGALDILFSIWGVLMRGQVNKRGALTGGFQDFRQSRMVCMKSMKVTQQKLRDLYQTQESIKEQSADLAKMLHEANAELQHKQAKADFTRKYIVQNEGDLRRLKEKQRGKMCGPMRREGTLASRSSHVALKNALPSRAQGPRTRLRDGRRLSIHIEEASSSWRERSGVSRAK